MSYTCPDCLWVSHNPNDDANNFCGHCDEYKQERFEPTTFQLSAIKALHSHAPIPRLLQVVAHERMQMAPLVEIHRELTRLTFALRIREQERTALNRILDRISGFCHPTEKIQ